MMEAQQRLGVRLMLGAIVMWACAAGVALALEYPTQAKQFIVGVGIGFLLSTAGRR